jgi:hypothetical protein
MGTVLHNVIDGMTESWVEGEQMGILLVDFVKAFDSVEHEYVRKCMEHFNIGPVLVKMVMTLLNDRKACINLGNMYSKTFNISRGTPQGDRASPYIFVICVEILLIKIELGGGGILRGRRAMNRRGENVNSLCEAFADDLKVLFNLMGGALKEILSILDNFSKLSGLAINREKTHIMVSGRDWEGGDSIEGIVVKKECRLLGVVIDAKVKNLQNNWETCTKKIKGLINYWNQYNLTITGRVLVAKTFLLPQVTFLLGIIPTDTATANRIERMIEEYTVGKLQIARDRIYNTVEQGGLELLKLDMLGISMGCAWINRWHREGDGTDITGSRVLDTARLGEPELINKDLIDKNKYPCARKIANSWHYFRHKLYENDGFMYHAYFFSNPGMRNRMGEMFGSSNVFSAGKYDEIREIVWETKVGDLCLRDEPKSKNEMEAVLGIELTGRE